MTTNCLFKVNTQGYISKGLLIEGMNQKEIITFDKDIKEGDTFVAHVDSVEGRARVKLVRTND